MSAPSSPLITLEPNQDHVCFTDSKEHELFVIMNFLHVLHKVNA